MQSIRYLSPHSIGSTVSCLKGKQSVYHSIQDAKDNLSTQELAELDKETKQLRNNILELKETEKSLRSELSNLKATSTLPELKNDLKLLTSERTDLEQRLSGLKSGDTKAISTEEKMDIERSWKLWSYKVNGRKKAFMELWQTLSENLPDGRNKDEIWDELGLETPKYT